jgi:hypothetical protein
MEAATRSDIGVFDGNIRAWQSTAETYSDPEMLAAMHAPVDLDDLVELLPPAARPE